MTIGYLILQIVCCNEVVTDHFTSNALDVETADMVCDKIDKYEQETGITVTKISATVDAYSSMIISRQEHRSEKSFRSGEFH